MQLQVHPPFPGPLPAGDPDRRPVTVTTVLGALGLAAVGITLGAVAVRSRTHGRLRCASNLPIVGVPLDYERHWWTDRGQGLYWKARRSGAATADDIALGILARELGEESSCLEQFPPHAGTHQQNVGLWEGLVAHVREEMDAERAVP
jgi:hypothetical protein